MIFFEESPQTLLQLEYIMMVIEELNSLPRASIERLNSPGHRIPGDQVHHEEKNKSFLKSLRTKQKFFIGTLNANTLSKIGKLKQLTDTLEIFKIKIVAIQETRFIDEEHFDTENYRIYKGKPATRINEGPKLFGTAFAVHKSIKDSIIDFHSPSERISTLSVKSANKAYTLINAHAPTNDQNRKNPMIVENFWEQLEETTNKIPKHHVKLLLGDFNAQLGKERKFRKITGVHTAHNRTNKNGEKLIHFCSLFNLKIMSTQFQKPKFKLHTWKSPRITLGQFQIDHVAISYANAGEILNIKTRRGFFESDHHLLQIKTKFQPRKKRLKGNKIKKLDPEYLKVNKNKILEDISKTETKNWTELVSTINANIELGEAPRKRKHRWWNITCDRAIEERVEAWKKFSSRRTTDNWQEFLSIQKQASKIIRTEKRKYDSNRLDELELEFKKNNNRCFYRTFKEMLTGYRPPNLCFRRPDGSLVTNTKDNCELLMNYFQRLLNCDPPNAKLSFVNPIPNPDSEPPTLYEIKNIIHLLKNGRAPGEDGIIAELWKLNDDELINRIYRIIGNIWETEQIPLEWKCALIHPLHKKGEKTDPNNYRGISILPVTYKILSSALLRRLEEQADHQIGEYQAGFRRGRSCSEQIWSLKTILQIRSCRNTVVTFVDFMKAYDSIDRETLFDTLKEFGIDKKTISIIQATLTNTTSKVKFMGEVSDPFEIRSGVRQGDGLSPLLFNIVLEKVIKTWEKDTRGIQIGKKKEHVMNIKCLAFADDLAILTNTRQEAKEALERLHEIAEKTGLQISYAKTQYMERLPSDNSDIVTRFGKVSRVPNFKYLGEIIQPSGLNTEANKQRVCKLQRAYCLTWNYYNKKSISINAKLRHYKTVILPEALYAVETTLLRGRTKIKEIQKQERKILRKIYGPINKNGIWMKRPTSEIYKDTEVITDVFRKRRLSFYGHIYRMDRSRNAKKLLNIVTNSKNKTKWLLEVEDDLKELNITELDLNDRNKFRNKVNKGKLQENTKVGITGTKWTDERKREHSERMKKIWQERKRKKS